MADQKISELNEKTTLHDTDLIPIVDVEAEIDETKKITGANLKSQVIVSGLENPPTEDEATKAPTSEWAFDHNARDATAEVQGHATAAQITKLDGIEAGADVTADHDPKAHVNSHLWLGTDEVNIKDLLVGKRCIYRIVPLGNFDGFTESVSGTGVTTPGFAYWLFSTGATQNSVACRYSASGDWFAYTDPAWRWRLFVRYNPRTITTGHNFWVGFFVTPTNPSETQANVSFYCDTNGELWASCGNGTDGSLVDTGVAITANGTFDLYFKYMASNVKYYINSVLVATITDYRPTATNMYFTVHQKNPDNAETRDARIYTVRMMAADE